MNFKYNRPLQKEISLWLFTIEFYLTWIPDVIASLGIPIALKASMSFVISSFPGIAQGKHSRILLLNCHVHDDKGMFIYCHKEVDKEMFVICSRYLWTGWRRI